MADNDAQAALSRTYRNWLSRVIRARNSAMVEGDLDKLCQSLSSYVRGFDGSPCDAALLTDQEMADSLPTSSTAKLYELLERYGDSNQEILIGIDFKSLVYQTQHYRNDRGLVYRVAQASVSRSKSQREGCSVLVIGNLADPDFVAVVPMQPYVPEHKGRAKIDGVYWQIGATHPSMAQCNPLPAALAPFVMHKSMIAEHLQNLVDNFNDESIPVVNPYSRLQYSQAIRMRPGGFDKLLKVGDTEARFRARLWNKFKSAYTNEVPTLSMSHPAYSPVTADVRFEHVDGGEVFVEIKRRAAKTRNLAGGRQRLRHSARTYGGYGAIFHMFVPWDYLLTMETEDEGYLICKDDIPQAFWHAEGDNEGMLTAEFNSQGFLTKRKIDLNAPDRTFVRRFQNLMSTDDGHLKKATFLPADIERIAGPCPIELLKQSVRVRDNSDVPEEGAMLDDGQVNPEDDEDNAALEVEEGGQDEGDATAQPDGKGAWTMGTLKARQRLQKGSGLSRDQQLFLPLMQQCRQYGEGCMIDLGLHHIYGRFAMVQYTWSEKDKTRYDSTGLPPLWLGKLKSRIPMVPILIHSIRFTYNYTSEEPTAAELNRMARGPPCLIIGVPLEAEVGEMVAQRWLIPSEQMPTVHAGFVKIDAGAAIPLLLANKLEVGAFSVNGPDLYHQLYKFVTLEMPFTIGLGDIDVDPADYLTSAGEFKTVAEAEFKDTLEARTWRFDPAELLRTDGPDGGDDGGAAHAGDDGADDGDADDGGAGNVDLDDSDASYVDNDAE